MAGKLVTLPDQITEFGFFDRFVGEAEFRRPDFAERDAAHGGLRIFFSLFNVAKNSPQSAQRNNREELKVQEDFLSRLKIFLVFLDSVNSVPSVAIYFSRTNLCRVNFFSFSSLGR